MIKAWKIFKSPCTRRLDACFAISVRKVATVISILCQSAGFSCNSPRAHRYVYVEMSNIDDRKVQWRAVMDASAGPKHRHLPPVVRRLKEIDDGSAAWATGRGKEGKERNWRVRREERARPRRRLDPAGWVGGIGFGRRAARWRWMPLMPRSRTRRRGQGVEFGLVSERGGEGCRRETPESRVDYWKCTR